MRCVAHKHAVQYCFEISNSHFWTSGPSNNHVQIVLALYICLTARLVLQGRYLPNSKWAPCDPDEQALAEDAQRLQVNNVAGISGTKHAYIGKTCAHESSCMGHMLAYKALSLWQVDIAISSSQAKLYCLSHDFCSEQTQAEVSHDSCVALLLMNSMTPQHTSELMKDPDLFVETEAQQGDSQFAFLL